MGLSASSRDVAGARSTKSRPCFEGAFQGRTLATLAETWLMFQQLGSAWTDAVAQEHWTSAPPIKSGWLLAVQNS